MGYRSDVYFSMSKCGFSFFKQQIPELLWIEPAGIEENGDYIFFFITYVKWYAGYSDVQAYEDALTKMDEAGYGYSFIRLGESNDDNEELSNLWCNCELRSELEEEVPQMCISRTVEFY